MSRDLMSDIYKEYENRGGFENLAGKGKPIPSEAFRGEPLNNVLKNANYLPEWIQQQHRVKAAILELLTKIINAEIIGDEIDKEVKEINVKVKKYNSICPSLLQKSPVTKETLRFDKDKWM
ncbi:DnaJ family domain-containing protein [Evansella sp. AB-rgal1]|uniref:DnaJ family domain-containing protein n=1 Tax=Evansella sp. AB-rgal1 TaxID=3242696 RepID=UPI00359E4E20